MAKLGKEGKPKSSAAKRSQAQVKVKVDKAAKPKRKAPEAPAAVEVDFPRGGGTTLTAAEYVSAQREGRQEAEQINDSAKRKRKLSARSEKRGGVPKAGKDKGKAREGHVKDAVRVEHLNYKRLAKGMKVAGMVIAVKPLELVVSLPNQLVGTVPITNVSELYNKRMEDESEDGDEDDENDEADGAEVKGLDDMFVLGQWVCCIVVSTQGALGSSRMSAVHRAAQRVTLSLDPHLVNASIPRADLGPGFCLAGVVKSREDRGYIVSLGVRNSTKKGRTSFVESFVAFDQAAKLGERLEIGQVVSCKIVGVADNGKTCKITFDPAEVASSQLTTATSVEAPLPLQLVACLVTAIIPGAGLNVKFLGFYDGTIDLFHIPSDSAVALESKFRVGQKVKARILWDQVGVDLEGPSKKFALSLLPHVVRLANAGAPGIGVAVTPVAFPIGHVFPSVQVTRIAEDWGLVCRCAESVLGFVHISSVADSHLASLSANAAGAYRVGTHHPARVIGSSPLDGFLSLSLQTSVLEKRFLQVADVRVGDGVQGKVKKLTDKGLFVEMDGNVDGVVWPVHLADIRLKHPERKFRPGQTVKARVFAVDTEKNRISLTLKKALLASPHPAWQSIDEVEAGTKQAGVVTKVMEKGLLLDFFGGLRALVPIGEAAEAYTDSLASRFSVGQVVEAKVIKITDGKITASIRQALGKPADDDAEFGGEVGIGDKVDGRVVAVHADNVVLRLVPSNAKGLVSLSILAKRRGSTVDDLRLTLSKGDAVEGLFVNRKNEERALAIVGFNPPTPKAGANGISSALDLSSLSVGQHLVGKVLQKLPNGVVVQISTNLKGRVAWVDSADDFDSIAKGDPVVNTMLPCVVVKVDPGLGRIDLSSRPSLVSPDAGAQVKDRVIEAATDVKADDKVRGVVRNIADSGLFVSLGRDVTARVQIRNLFDDYVKDWKPRFAVGQVVEGKVVSVDPTTGKVELSLCKNADAKAKNPEAGGKEIGDFEEGDLVDAVVKGVERYGAFLKIEGTRVSGLCHKSQVVEDLDHHDWKERVKEGAKVKAVVLSVDAEGKKIGFTLRQSTLAEKGVFVDEEEIEGREDESEGDQGSESNVVFELGQGHIGGDASKEDDDEASVEDGYGEDEEEEEADEEHEEEAVAVANGKPKPTSTLTLAGDFSWTGIAEAAAEEDEQSDSDAAVDVAGDEQARPVKKRRISPSLAVSALGPAPGDVKPTTVDDFHRLLLGAPNSSFLWIQLVSFHLGNGDVPSARATARRAVGLGEAGEGAGIDPREDEERWNVWAAWLGLEVKYGSEGDVEGAFVKACGACDAKQVWLKLGDLYQSAGQIEKASLHYARLVKKFSQSSNAWTTAGQFALTHPEATTASKQAVARFDGTPVGSAHELLQRSMKSLEKRKHVETVLKFAMLEFKHGSAERARTLFEGLLSTTPKRTDLWNVYVDMEVAHGGVVSGDDVGKERVRGLFGRMVGLGMNAKRTKFAFKKWLAFEETHGAEEDQERVKDKAREYVARLAARTEVATTAEDEEDEEMDG